jgi:hypothetical protein
MQSTPRCLGVPPLRNQNRPRIGRGTRDVARVRGARASKPMYAPPASHVWILRAALLECGREAAAFRLWFIRELSKPQNPESGSCCDRTPKAGCARNEASLLRGPGVQVRGFSALHLFQSARRSPPCHNCPAFSVRPISTHANSRNQRKAADLGQQVRATCLLDKHPELLKDIV